MAYGNIFMLRQYKCVRVCMYVCSYVLYPFSYASLVPIGYFYGWMLVQGIAPTILTI